MKYRSLQFIILVISVIFAVGFACRTQRQSPPPAPYFTNQDPNFQVPAMGVFPEPLFITGNASPRMSASPSAFQKALNPTSSPIGGGPGYKELISEKNATYSVYDKTSLKASLAKAKSGDIIFINGQSRIDLSGEKLVIPGGVTLASNRGDGDNPGALLFSNTMYPEESVDTYEDYLFATGGKNVRITGLRLRGPSAEIDEHAAFVACGVKGRHGYLTVDNCELSHWLKWAADLAVAHGDYIHHNYIHHTRRAGFGYGIWVRGSDTKEAPPRAAIPLIEANLLENCRHEIASGGQATSSYIARHNVIARHGMSNHMIDRHHQGYYTEVSNNVIAPANHIIFHGMAQAPLDALTFTGNWCDEKDIKKAFPNYANKGWNIRVKDNELGGAWRVHQPLVELSADITEGSTPLTVTFSAKGSDPDAYPIDAYIWDIIDGRDMRISASGMMRMTFDKPGVYTLRVRVRNSYGLPSEPASINIHVREGTLNTTKPVPKGLVAFWDFENKSEWNFDLSKLYRLEADGPAPIIVNGFEGFAIQRNADPRELIQNPHIRHSLARALQPGTSDFSFSLAFKINSLQAPNTFVGLLGYGAGSEYEAGYNLTFRSSQPNELSLFVSNGRGKRDRVVIKTGIEPGRWYHVVVSVSRITGYKAYVDGMEVVSQKISMQGDDIYHDYHAFGVLGRFVQYPRASIDQVGCWDRALDHAEAIWLYNQGKGRTSSEINPH